MSVLELVEDAAAVHRLSRLVVVDSIAEPVRTAWVRLCYFAVNRPVPTGPAWEEPVKLAMRDEGMPKAVELAACVHCVGVWAALVVLVLRRRRAGRLVIRLLATSGIHTALAELAER